MTDLLVTKAAMQREDDLEACIEVLKVLANNIGSMCETDSINALNRLPAHIRERMRVSELRELADEIIKAVTSAPLENKDNI